MECLDSEETDMDRPGLEAFMSENSSPPPFRTVDELTRSFALFFCGAKSVLGELLQFIADWKAAKVAAMKLLFSCSIFGKPAVAPKSACCIWSS